MHTLKVGDSAYQRLQRIAQYRSLDEEHTLDEILQEAEYDYLDDQAFDEAARSPEVREEILKLNRVLKDKGL